MKRITILFTILFSVIRLSAQVGIINDSDGFTNVREKADINSKVIYQLNDWEVFFIDVEYLELDKPWIKIYVPKNRFSIYKDEINDTQGFVHRSKIKNLKSLNTITRSEVFLEFEIIKDNTHKVIESGKENRVSFGLDIPLSMSYEVKNLTLNWQGKTIPIKKDLYKDLYNVNFKTGKYSSKQKRFNTFSQNNIYYIQQKCADGGGFYMIVWVIKDGEIIQRLVGWIV